MQFSQEFVLNDVVLSAIKKFPIPAMDVETLPTFSVLKAKFPSSNY